MIIFFDIKAFIELGCLPVFLLFFIFRHFKKLILILAIFLVQHKVIIFNLIFSRI